MRSRPALAIPLLVVLVACSSGEPPPTGTPSSSPGTTSEATQPPGGPSAEPSAPPAAPAGLYANNRSRRALVIRLEGGIVRDVLLPADSAGVVAFPEQLADVAPVTLTMLDGDCQPLGGDLLKGATYALVRVTRRREIDVLAGGQLRGRELPSERLVGTARCA